VTDTISGVRRSLDIELDWVTAALVSLFAGFQLVALYAVGMEFAPPQQQSSNVALSGRLFALLLIEVVVIVALWRGWNYLPDWMQTLLKYAIYGGISGVLLSLHLSFVYAVATTGATTAAGLFAVLPGVLYAVLKYTAKHGYLWIGFNLAAFSGGILMTVMASHVLAPVALIPLMIALMAYDYAAVDLTDIMGDILNFSTSAGIPNYLIIPAQRSIDLETVTEYVAGESDGSPDSVAFIIGVGDFVFPTALVASAYIAHDGVSLAVAGGIAGTLAAAVTLRAALAGGGRLPALPWLNSGAIAGFALGLTGMVIL